VVNFTVSMPEDLKAEMDKFPDVNWSELTRKNIQNYLQNRKNTFPPLEFALKEVHFTYLDNLMQPSMSVKLEVNNKLDSQLIIDRMLFTVKFVKEHFNPSGEDFKIAEAKEKSSLQGVFKDSSLDYRSLCSGISNINIRLSPPVEVLRRLSDKMQASFWTDISLMAYIQGFENPAIKNLSVKIPIDEWKNEVRESLNNYDSNWSQVHAH
jgi:hypothetical protein